MSFEAIGAVFAQAVTDGGLPADHAGRLDDGALSSQELEALAGADEAEFNEFADRASLAHKKDN